MRNAQVSDTTDDELCYVFDKHLVIEKNLSNSRLILKFP